MAQKNVIKGSAIIPNPNDATKRLVRAKEWTLIFSDGTTALDVFASESAIMNSFSTKNQITIVSIEEDESIKDNNDSTVSIVSTAGIKFEPK